MREARARAGFHRGLPAARRANTAAKDAAVWPEGERGVPRRGGQQLHRRVHREGPDPVHQGA